MSWQDVGNLISKSAPLLGLAIGGPVGAAVGSAASLLTSIFGGNSQDANDLVAKITADPDREVKLAKLEYDNQQTILELNKMHFADVANARQREIDLAKAGKADDTQKILALGFTFGVFIWLLCIFIFPDTKNDTVTMGLLSAVTIILSYYFGSSKDNGGK